jgi:hypothetical protein
MSEFVGLGSKSGKKCPTCNGCTYYAYTQNLCLIFCDFCRKYFTRDPQVGLKEIENLDTFVEITRKGFTPGE